MKSIAALVGLLAVLAAASPAAAQGADKYPDKPIRIMAPYAPGGNIDVTARIIAEKLKDVLGVNVLVENKAGASGMIGSDVIARSPPDGYNLLVSANSLVAVPRSTATRRTTGAPPSSRSATSRTCRPC